MEHLICEVKAGVEHLNSSKVRKRRPPPLPRFLGSSPCLCNRQPHIPPSGEDLKYAAFLSPRQRRRDSGRIDRRVKEDSQTLPRTGRASENIPNRPEEPKPTVSAHADPGHRRTFPALLRRSGLMYNPIKNPVTPLMGPLESSSSWVSPSN